MDSTQLRSFLTVADCGSFSRAEDIVFLSKQALLKQINNLEAEVGVPLLKRSSGGVKLTEEGKTFYAGARSILDETDTLVQNCRRPGNYKENLRLSNVEHQKLLTPVLNAFVRTCPDVQIDYIIHPNHSGEFRVSEGFMDVGETFFDPDFMPTVSLTRDTDALRYYRLADFPYVAVLSPQNPLAGREKLRFEDLAGGEVSYFKFITRQGVIDALEEAFRDAPERLTVRADVDNQIGATFECAASDKIIVTCNPYIYYMENVKRIPLECGVTQEYGLLCAANPTPAAQRFVDMARFLFRKYGADLVIHHEKYR